MPRAVLAFLLLALPGLSQQSGRVEGRVRSSTGEPVAKATVRLTTSAGAGQPSVNYVELTSSDGRFTAENLKSGRYVISAQRSGFTAARNPAGALVSNIELAAGETKTGVEIILTPLGVVSGTVTDADGDPVPNAQVRLLRYTFSQGRVTMNTSGPSTAGDDRGMFRLLNVQPGRYYLSASGGMPPPVLNEVRGRSALESNLPTYYPNASEARGAIAITVAAGEVGNLNIRLRRGMTYSIQGKMVDASGAAVNGQISVVPVGGASLPQEINTQTREGVFQAGGLAAGEYTVIARSSAAQATGRTGTAPVLSGRLDVSVRGANVEDLTIRLAKGAEVTGHVTLDSGAALSATPANKGNPTPNVRLTALEGPVGQANSQILADGSFRIADLSPLKRALQVTPLPSNTYIKSVRFRGADVTRAALDFSAGAGGVLDIVIGTKAAEIQAAPVNDKGETPEGGAAFSIWPRVPNPGSPTGDVRAGPVATSSRTQGLAPGDYYVAAWPQDSEYLRIPDFLSHFTTLATKVTVAEGESIRVDAKVISRDAVEREIAQFPW